VRISPTCSDTVSSSWRAQAVRRERDRGLACSLARARLAAAARQLAIARKVSIISRRLAVVLERIERPLRLIGVSARRRPAGWSCFLGACPERFLGCCLWAASLYVILGAQDRSGQEPGKQARAGEQDEERSLCDTQASLNCLHANKTGTGPFARFAVMSGCPVFRLSCVGVCRLRRRSLDGVLLTSSLGVEITNTRRSMAGNPPFAPKYWSCGNATHLRHKGLTRAFSIGKPITGSSFTNELKPAGEFVCPTFIRPRHRRRVQKSGRHDPRKHATCIRKSRLPWQASF